jgi:hypothetical protein
MSDRKLDELSKALATTTSRRQMLKVLAATAVGGAVSLAGARGARAARCRKVGQLCRANFECCDFFCPPNTGRCACPPGENLCTKTKRCIRCDPEATFDPDTCQCICPEGTTQCGNECCSGGEECCPGGYYGPTCCPPGEICCPGGFCSYYGGQC